MSIEAMKQALEALEGLWDDGFGGVPESMHKDAITALRQAIEQAEKQEPVAWVVFDHKNNDIVWTEEGKKLKPETPLYTALVHASDISQERVDETAKRKHEWVGLTDEEIEAIYDQENHADVVLLTQAKLKEKNT